jgi:Cu/Ag efflux protein CusF
MRTVTAVLVTVLAGGFSSSLVSAQETTLKGQIIKTDEAAGTITMQHDQPSTVGSGAGSATGATSATATLKVQDGLLFNAVKPGDQVEVTVEQINGKMTVTKIKKE